MGREGCGQDDSECEDDDDVQGAAEEGSAEEDPVEDCSDGEAPVPPPNPRTPPGAAGRFAVLLGVPHSGGKRPPWVPGGAAAGPAASAGSDPAAGHEQPVATAAGGSSIRSGAPAAADTIFDDAGDTAPASPEALLQAAYSHDDGTMGAGVPHCPDEPESIEETQIGVPTLAEPFAGMGMDIPAYPEPGDVAADNDATDAGHGHAEADAPPPPPQDIGAEVDAAAAPKAADEEASGDEEDSGGEDAGSFAPLPDEPWMTYEDHERELWDHVRPRTLRREGAQLNGLRLPTAAVNRVMRLHPDLQIRSLEATEVMNYSLVLLMQAVTRAALRRKSVGQRVQFEDIKDACVGRRELSFLQPVSCTLDASARILRSDISAAANGAADADAGGDGPGGAAAGGKRAPAAPGPGQSVLSKSIFQNNIAHRSADAAEADSLGSADGAAGFGADPAIEIEVAAAEEFTPDRRLQGSGPEKPSRKRTAPDSAAKPGSGKAPRRGAAKEAVAAGPGIAAFFKRPSTAGN